MALPKALPECIKHLQCNDVLEETRDMGYGLQCWTCDVLGVFYSFEASNTEFWPHFNGFFQGRPSDHWKPRFSQNRNPTVSGFFRSSCLAACMRAVACSSPSTGHLHWWGPYHVVWSKTKKQQQKLRSPEFLRVMGEGFEQDLIFMFKNHYRTSKPWCKQSPIDTPRHVCQDQKSQNGGMVIPHSIGNPYIGYTNPIVYYWVYKPYYWVNDHPLLYGSNGSLDPSTCGDKGPEFMVERSLLVGWFSWEINGKILDQYSWSPLFMIYISM